MDISKSYQQCEINKGVTFVDHIDFSAPLDCKVGCYGVKGSNSEEATKWIFGNRKKIEFYREFEDVFRAVQDGTIDMIATDHAPHSLEEKMWSPGPHPVYNSSIRNGRRICYGISGRTF